MLPVAPMPEGRHDGGMSRRTDQTPPQHRPPHPIGARRRAMRQAGLLAVDAMRQHQAGQLDEADRLYRQALTLQPDQADSLHGLGVLALGRGQSGQAIAFIGRAVAARPEIAHYYLNLGLALREQGHGEEARAALQVAVLRDPDDPRAQLALALMLESLGRLAEATAAAREAVARDPGHGTPASCAPGASALLARLQHQAGRLPEALASLRDAAGEAPADAGAWHQLGAALGSQGLLDEAEAAFRRTAALAPGDPAALANLGGLLFERNAFDEAAELLRRAVAAGPATAATRSNLGLVLMAQGLLPEAERQLAEAAALAPEQEGILVNRGSVLADLGRHDEAEACFLSVEARSPPGSPDAVRARFNRATVLLATGRQAEGWPAFEARRALLPDPPSDLPEWDGRPLADGASLLLHAEQGLGDAIQFLRYVPLAAGRVPVLLMLPEPLRRLAACLASDRCRVLAGPERDTGSCAAQASLLSLPALLEQKAAPPAGAYLQAPAHERQAASDWVRSLGDGLRVGLCWAGGPGYRFDRRRSLRLDALAALADVPGLQLVSLQQGEAARQTPPAGLRINYPAGPPGDLARTAALIEQLDLVVSVDTAIAHLAGALGRPVWLLNRFGGDWRWQDGFVDQAGRSLWYPSLRQFRQQAPLPPEQAWLAPIGMLAAALRREAAAAG